MSRTDSPPLVRSCVSCWQTFTVRTLLRCRRPPEPERRRQRTTSTTSIDSRGRQAAYANLHTDQERDDVRQRYQEGIASGGGKTSEDADNRPLLAMRAKLGASGDDVEGTDQT